MSAKKCYEVDCTLSIPDPRMCHKPSRRPVKKECSEEEEEEEEEDNVRTRDPLLSAKAKATMCHNTWWRKINYLQPIKKDFNFKILLILYLVLWEIKLSWNTMTMNVRCSQGRKWVVGRQTWISPKEKSWLDDSNHVVSVQFSPTNYLMLGTYSFLKWYKWIMQLSP